MSEPSDMDIATLKEIDREEGNPGSGLISEAHCDEMVTLGWAEGDYVNGYRLTEAGHDGLSDASD